MKEISFNYGNLFDFAVKEGAIVTARTHKDGLKVGDTVQLTHKVTGRTATGDITRLEEYSSIFNINNAWWWGYYLEAGFTKPSEWIGAFWKMHRRFKSGKIYFIWISWISEIKLERSKK